MKIVGAVSFVVNALIKIISKLFVLQNSLKAQKQPPLKFSKKEALNSLNSYLKFITTKATDYRS